MCIGIPMQVVEAHGLYAICQDPQGTMEVDTRLVGQARAGQWLLVFLGTAREILDETTALSMRDAVSAMQRIMTGDTRVDQLFSDLIDREPPVPDHLKPLIGDKS